MTSTRRRVLGLAAGLALATPALSLPAHAHGTVPVQPGPDQPYITEGATGRAGALTIKVTNSTKLGEGDVWETMVTVCNRGSEPHAVGPDGFSYTIADGVTRVYQPHQGYLERGLTNQYLQPGSCVTGSLVNTDRSPLQFAWTDPHTLERTDILPATEWEGIAKVGWPRAAGTSNYYGDHSNDRVADVIGLAGGKQVAYRTVAGPTLVTAGPTGATGTWTWMGKAGDVDHNGATDLLLRDTTGTLWLQYMQGNHRAGFRTIVGYDFDDYRLLTVVNDVTGDGHPEILGVHKDGRLLRQTVDVPRVGTRVQVGTGWGAMTRLASTGDLSGDGRADLLAVRSDGGLYRYAFSSRGTVSSTARIGHGWQAMRQVTSPGDMDRDGRRDLVAVRSDGDLYFYGNRGGGRWAPARQVGSNWTRVTSLA